MKKHRLGMIVRSSVFTLLTCLGSQASVFAEDPSTATALFKDEFNQTTLDTRKWGVGNWQMGRAYLDKKPTLGSEAGVTFVTLPLNTYHPNYPGQLLQGAEIYSLSTFAFPRRASGLEFEARVRVRSETRGSVAAFFTWNYNSRKGATLTDEMDFEYLTSLPSDQVLLTTWNNWDYTNPVYNDGIHHSDAVVAVGGLNRNVWTTLKIRWLKNRTEWYVNDVLARSTSDAHADNSMHVHFNFWAPEADWTGAYDVGLQPALTADRNVTYLYDVDYVRVTTIP